MTIDEAVRRVQEMHDAAKAVNPDILVLCHGGPIAEPDDARYVLERTHGVVGFYGASSMERLPTEVAITENMRAVQGDLAHRMTVAATLDADALTRGLTQETLVILSAARNPPAKPVRVSGRSWSKTSADFVVECFAQGFFASSE